MKNCEYRDYFAPGDPCWAKPKLPIDPNEVARKWKELKGQEPDPVEVDREARRRLPFFNPAHDHLLD